MDAHGKRTVLVLWAGSRGRSECDRTGRYGMMARMAKSAGRSAWYRDPWNAGMAAVTVAALVFAGYAGVSAATRDNGPDYVSTYTPPPSTSGTCVSTPIERGAKVSVVGDSYVTGQQQGGIGDAGWPALLGASTGWAVESVAVGGSGYISGGFNGVDYSGPDFVQQAGSTKDSALVLVFGGRNDVQHFRGADSYEQKVRQTISAIRGNNPGAPIVVFTSPVTQNLDVEGLNQVNAAITSITADLNCVSLVNTVDQGWFVGADAGLIGADGIHPTDGGHEYMEGKVEADLAQLGFIAAAPPA